MRTPPRLQTILRCCSPGCRRQLPDSDLCLRLVRAPSTESASKLTTSCDSRSPYVPDRKGGRFELFPLGEVISCVNCATTRQRPAASLRPVTHVRFQQMISTITFRLNATSPTL